MKSLRLMKTVAAALKIRRKNLSGNLLRKIAAENFCGKLPRNTKSMRLTIYDRNKADVEISASGKIAAPAKLPRL